MEAEDKVHMMLSHLEINSNYQFKAQAEVFHISWQISQNAFPFDFLL